MTTTAIRLSDESILALAKVLEFVGSQPDLLNGRLVVPDELAYEIAVVKLTRAASDIVNADTASRRRTEPDRALRIFQAAMDETPPPPLCPECQTGKHGNCDGLTWDAVKDDAVACPCLAIGPAGLELHPLRATARA